MNWKNLFGTNKKHYVEQTIEIEAIDYPIFSQHEMNQITVSLASTVSDSIISLTVIRQYGSIFIIRFRMASTNSEYIFQVEPIFPFIFREYGYPYRKAYKHLAEMFLYDFGNFPYEGASVNAQTCIDLAMADTGLTTDEKNYYKDAMLWVVSAPTLSVNEVNWFMD